MRKFLITMLSSFLACGVLLAAGNVVPRAANSGTLGTSSKPWGGSYVATNNLPSGTTVNKSATNSDFVVKGGEGSTAGLSLDADEADDSADSFDLVMGTDGIADVTVGGTETINMASTYTAFDKFFTMTVEARSSGLADALTPTNSAIFLTASAATTNTIVAPVLAGASIGTPLLIVNVGAEDIKFEDGTTLSLTGDLTIGQYDSLSLIAATTGIWVEVSTSDN